MMMKSKDNIRVAVLVIAILTAFGIQADAQGRPTPRKHSVTEAETLNLVKATQSNSNARVSIQATNGRRIIRSNGLPDHAVGRFPNRGNPHTIKAQNYSFSMPMTPGVGQSKSISRSSLFGVAVNGVPFDPGTAEVWKGNRRSGWHYEALGGAISLGLDSNYAHVQPNGAYHYHGLPVGLMQELGWTSKAASPLIGYAADGFPIYAVTATVNGAVQKMTSSYQLKSGARPGGSGPSGRYDGAFVEDYTFVAGSGTLDQCNGTTLKTAEYPNGTYAYFLTEHFPVVPRCLVGQANASFSKHPR